MPNQASQAAILRGMIREEALRTQAIITPLEVPLSITLATYLPSCHPEAKLVIHFKDTFKCGDVGVSAG